MYPPPPPEARGLHISFRRQNTTKVMAYNIIIVIQAIIFKQMLVRKLFVVRSDASRFTATIYYSLFGGNAVIIGT